MTPTSTNPASLTWSGVTARRMARHALTEPASGLGPADIAGVLCGAHAQVLSAAELSIGRRIAGATRADVQRALWEDRTLVKTFGPRGTVHLLPTADLPMWTGALSALPSSVPTHPEPVRFTADQADEVIAAIGDALADTRADRRRADRGDRGAHRPVGRRADDGGVPGPVAALAPAHEHGRAPRHALLRTGPGPQGDLHQPAPLAARLPARRRRGAPCARLVTRYLYAYGPATPQHFARWLSIPPRRAVELFDELAGELEHVELDGEPGWTVAGDTADAASAAPRAPPAALLRRLRRRRPAPGAAVPGRGRDPRAHPGGPGRQLPGAARRRRGRWGVAPAALRPQARHHRRTAAPS